MITVKIKIFILQCFKFGLVGILNTIVGLSTIFICMKLLHISYISSNIIGYSLGLINSFIFNKLWTFKSTKSAKKEIIPFIFIFAISYFFQLIILILMKEYMSINVDLAQIISTVFYTIINFFGNRIYTFSHVEIENDEATY